MADDEGKLYRVKVKDPSFIVISGIFVSSRSVPPAK
jgi:hypothetical protein